VLNGIQDENSGFSLIFFITGMLIQGFNFSNSKVPGIGTFI